MKLALPTLLVAGALGFGCNLLLDVDGYRRIDASSSPQETGSPDEDAGADADADANVDGDVPPGALAGYWAQWTMPNGIEAGISPSRYSFKAGNTVFDEITGLTWSRSVGTASSYEKAREACTNRGPYRLPTRIELVSLLEYQVRQEPTYFAKELGLDGPIPLRYWTRSYVLPTSSAGYSFWMVDFSNGTTVQEKPSGAGYGVVCIKDGA